MEKRKRASLQELKPMEELDVLFHELASDESLNIPEGLKSGLEEVLNRAGANLEIGEDGRESLRESKYTEKYPNRRKGLVEVWGERRVGGYEKWSEIKSKHCPRFTFKREGKLVNIEGSRGRGLRHFCADLSSLAVGEMSEEDFIKRTQWRVRKGKAHSFKRMIGKELGKKSEEYKKLKREYIGIDKRSKEECNVKKLAMIPWFEEGGRSYVGVVWKHLRGGNLPEGEN